MAPAARPNARPGPMPRPRASAGAGAATAVTPPAATVARTASGFFMIFLLRISQGQRGSPAMVARRMELGALKKSLPRRNEQVVSGLDPQVRKPRPSGEATARRPRQY